MSAVRSLEARLEETFTKTLPPLPKGAKDFLVEFAPWLSLIAGGLSVLGVWQIWQWASVARSIDIYNSFATQYGGTVIGSRWSLGIWISLLVILIQGVLYFMAYKPLAARQITGWRLIFYSVLVGIAGSIIIALTAYGGIGRVIGTLIGAAIAFYLLFQVKSRYHETGKVGPKADSPNPPTA